MLDHLGLVHMNGRLYDPVLGRFLSADPNVQSPGNFQNYNRYSYVLNNPLSLTDPSGHFFKSIGNFFKKFWRPILAIALSIVVAGAFLAIYYTAMGTIGSVSLLSGMAAVVNGGFIVGATAGAIVSGGLAIAAAALGGFVGGLVATGSLKGALFGALTGAVAAGIGNAFQMSWAGKLGKFKELSRAMAHGISGGVIGDLQGGRFGAGFLSGSFSSMASSYGPMSGKGYTAELIQAAVTGGTGSVLGGGKFENGAVTGAFTYMFNKGLHPEEPVMEGAEGKEPMIDLTGKKVLFVYDGSDMQQIEGGVSSGTLFRYLVANGVAEAGQGSTSISSRYWSAGIQRVLSSSGSFDYVIFLDHGDGVPVFDNKFNDISKNAGLMTQLGAKINDGGKIILLGCNEPGVITTSVHDMARNSGRTVIAANSKINIVSTMQGSDLRVESFASFIDRNQNKFTAISH